MDMVVMDMVDMDMVDIFMSRTFLAQFGLVSSFIYIRTSYNIGKIVYDYDYTSCFRQTDLALRAHECQVESNWRGWL